MIPAGHPHPHPPTGAGQARVTLGLVLLAWLLQGLQECFLFLRQSPYGTPYVSHASQFLPFAIVWNLWAALVPALPLLAWWLSRWDRQVSARRARGAQTALLAVLIAVTALDQFDNELMRFMGLHLSLSLVRTYGNVSAWTADMVELFRRDRGGAGLPFLLLASGTLGLWWSGRRLILGAPAAGSPSRPRALLLLGAMLLLPATTFVLFPSGNRWRRAKPALAAVYRESRIRARWGERPGDLPDRVGEYQRQWLAESTDRAWRFPDSAYPLVRVPDGAAGPTASRPNFLYIQLETFRGWDVGFLRPDREFTPTPFLDSLARDRRSAAWIRHLSFGPETVNGLFAGHCSVKPHRRASPTAMFTDTRFYCFPEALRAHGWHTEFITGVDPDWDFQTLWLERWYDRIEVPRREEEEDRAVFRRAARLADELATRPAPFLLTIVSYSNHLPFRSREAGYDLVHSTRPDSAIWNTMHYTDAVLAEFWRTVTARPWFRNTVVIITGDHGENLGEHDGTAAQRSGWRETVWVPLLIHGGDPRLPTGLRPEVASLLDVAPTIADLAGVRERVPWMGHSLLEPVPAGRTASGYRKAAAFADRGRFSFVADPADGTLHLYDAFTDPLQRHDLAASFPDTAAALRRRLRRDQRLVDYLLESNRIWPGKETP